MKSIIRLANLGKCQSIDFRQFIPRPGWYVESFLVDLQEMQNFLFYFGN